MHRWFLGSNICRILQLWVAHLVRADNEQCGVRFHILYHFSMLTTIIYSVMNVSLLPGRDIEDKLFGVLVRLPLSPCHQVPHLSLLPLPPRTPAWVQRSPSVRSFIVIV